MSDNTNSPEWPLKRLYELISGPCDYERPWDELASLFLPGARIRTQLKTSEATKIACDWSVAEFATAAAEYYRRQGFWDKEVASVTETFGDIAHIMSVYESRLEGPEAAPSYSGVNSVQLLRRDGKWSIASVVFQLENPCLPIPAHYLLRL